MSLKDQVVLELAILKHVERINYTKAKYLRENVDGTVKEIRTHLRNLEEQEAVKREQDYGEWRILL